MNAMYVLCLLNASYNLDIVELSNTFIISLFIIPILSLYRKRARECAKYASVIHCTIPVWLFFFCLFFFLLKEEEAKTKCTGIINLLFGVLVDNTRGHFTLCTHFSSPLRGLEKYCVTRKISARIIYQNKVYKMTKGECRLQTFRANEL